MKNNVWFDLTTSMQWTGGIVGIVRAELEVAYNLHKINKDIKFFMLDGVSFKEIPEHSLNWLWSATDISEAYLKIKKINVSTKTSNYIEIESKINQLKAEMPSRMLRLKSAILFFNSILPNLLQRVVIVISYIPKKIYNFISYISRYIPRSRSKPRVNNKHYEKTEYPFSNNDTVISMGWMDSNKENIFSTIKLEAGISLVYLVYDLILINDQTTHLYHKIGTDKFLNYFKWISYNCDFLLFGGNTAKLDANLFQSKHNWPSPQGVAIKFGSDIVISNDTKNDVNILNNLGINGDFIITVGSIEARKNHDVLYKAYCILSEKNENQLPLMVFVGKLSWGTSDLIDSIKRNPRVENKILIISPTDIELDCLYRNCKFTLLPSLYEGWSLTLPESLGYGKFCLTSDVPPLREIGENLVDFIDPFDPFKWAEKISYYVKNPTVLREKEQNIIKNWVNTTWYDCALKINSEVKEFITKKEEEVAEEVEVNDRPYIWYDMTTSYAQWRGGMTGIIRTELILGKELFHSKENVRFFAFYADNFFEINKENLSMIFSPDSIDDGYLNFQNYWREKESRGEEYRIPAECIPAPVLTPPEIERIKNAYPSRVARLYQSIFLGMSTLPNCITKYAIYTLSSMMPVLKKSIDEKREDKFTSYPDEMLKQKLPFKEHDIIFSVGIDWSTKTLKIIKANKASVNFKVCNLIYDLTPVITPELHMELNQKLYHNFLFEVSEVADMILYGGETALNDSINYQRKFHWKEPKAIAVRFGSNLFSSKNIEPEKDISILKKYEINKAFILSVGTIEIRKNHESLYKAYLTLIQSGVKNLPIMVFVGKKGWKIDSIFDSMINDPRVKNKIKIISPSDEELDCLYRNCEFTLLASMYEGWSLTLPESLSHGKFCIVSDVPPLREVGQNFVDYVHPWDVAGWASKIKYYSQNHKALQKAEEKIKNEWKPITWHEFYLDVMDKINMLKIEDN